MKSLHITENRMFFIAGTFFLAVQLLIVSSLVFNTESRPLLLWLCNNFCIFLAYACFTKNMQMVKGVSYLGLIPQALWMADFVSPVFGFNVSSITDYIATDGLTYTNSVSIALHMIVPLAVLLLSFRTFPKAVSLLYASLYGSLLYIATILFGMKSEDINCIKYACHTSINIPYQIWLWPAYAFIVGALAYGVHHFLYAFWWKLLPKVHGIAYTWYSQQSARTTDEHSS